METFGVDSKRDANKCSDVAFTPSPHIHSRLGTFLGFDPGDKVCAHLLAGNYFKCSFCRNFLGGRWFRNLLLENVRVVVRWWWWWCHVMV